MLGGGDDAASYNDAGFSCPPQSKTTVACGFVSLRSMAQTSMIRRFLKNYLPRHRNRTNQFLHMIGVPLTFIGTPVAIAQGVEWYWPLLCFLGGYGLQFAGHAVEGNDAGEIVFLKKKLGMPYTEYGPQSEYSRGPEQHDDTSCG